MVRIKFTTARPRTRVVSPKFGSIASDEVLKAFAEYKETSTEQLEEYQGGQQAVISTKAASEQGAGFDQGNQSKGFSSDETTSDNGVRVKIGVEAALAGIRYDFGQSAITKACIASLESFARYFPKGYGRAPGAESVPDPHENEAVVFEDFFAAGLRMPSHLGPFGYICACSRCSCIS
jgi:hypothetical protein